MRGRHVRRQDRRRGAGRFAVTVVTGMLLGVTASAVGSTHIDVEDLTLFELGDLPGATLSPGTGDIVDDPLKPAPDWGSLFDAEGNTVGPLPANSIARFIGDDLALKGLKDSTTWAGSNKNNDLVSTYNWDEGNTQPKDDLSNIYVYGALDGNDDLIIYVGLERIAPEGASHIDVEFNQSAVSLDKDPGCDDDGTAGPDDGAPCEFIGTRTEGDVVITMDFEKGGALGFLEVRRWNGTQFALIDSAAGEGCNDDNTVCGVNNGAPIDTGPWDSVDRQLNPLDKIPENAFTEIGLNLSEILGQQQVCLGSVIAKSRASGLSFNSELSDFAGPEPFDLCAANITIGPDGVNTVGEPHEFTATITKTFLGSPIPSGDEIVSFSIDSGSASFVDDGVDSDGDGVQGNDCVTDVAGQCSIHVTSDSVISAVVSASAEVSFGGQTIPVTTDGEGSNSGPAIKYWVDASIAVDPDGVNAVGEEHIFTVTVTPAGSSALTATVDEINFTLSDPSVGVSNTCDDSNDWDTTTTSGSTLCTVTVNSASPGSVSIDADASVTFSDGTYSETILPDTTGDPGPAGDDGAIKYWVDASIAVDPDGVNEVGTQHTFKVTVTAAPGAVTGVTFDSITPTVNGGTIDSNGCSTPTVDGNTATCDVIVSSNAVQTTTIDAAAAITFTEGSNSETVDVDTAGESGPAGDDGATKYWVDADVQVTPTETNGIGEDHVFTITANAYPGAVTGVNFDSITYSLTDASKYVSDTCGTPTIGVNTASCTVTVTSATAGATTITGNVQVTFTEGSFSDTVTRSTDGSTTPAGNTNSSTATKTWVDAGLTWLKHDDLGALLGGATFEVCRIEDRFGTADGTCFTVADEVDASDSTPDEDPVGGQFALTGLPLGVYTIEEIAAPGGYTLDPAVVKVDLTGINGTSGPSVNVATDPVLVDGVADADGYIWVNTPPNEGCTPGFWQGGNGINLWNQEDSPLALAVTQALTDSGLTPTDVFYTGATFDSIFGGGDMRTLLEIVGSGGGSEFINKSKRDLIAALLNAVDSQINYPATVAQILDDWAAASGNGDPNAAPLDSYEEFHSKYGAFNELGCDRTNSSSAAAIVALPIAGLAFGLARRGRHRKRRF